MSAPARVLPVTGLTATVVAAGRDLLEHLVPLVLANIVWAVVAFVAWLAALVWVPLGVVVAIALVWPTATVSGVAVRVVRGDEVGVRDALRWPVGRPSTVLVGALVVVVGVVLVVDVGVSLGRDDVLGIALATAAGWGLAALTVLACVVWPLLGDPARRSLGARQLVRLAATIALVRTPGIVAVSIVVVVLLLASVVLAAAVTTVSVSLAALILARVVLPIADGIDPPGDG